jgi:hypothetical protein
MFIGHYGPAFGAKAGCGPFPLWVLFVAVQFMDVIWSIFVLSGIEKMRIVPGFMPASSLDLYYMPYTHGLFGALALSVDLRRHRGAVACASDAAPSSSSSRPPCFRIGFSICSCTSRICGSMTT